VNARKALTTVGTGASVITMLRIPCIFSVFLLLAACAPEAPQALTTPLPLPPPAPPRAPAQRALQRPAVPANDQATLPAADAATLAAAGVPGAAAERAPVWRVARDGVVGCADRAALDVLSQAAESVPRLVAEARAAGGCRTTFRVNEWALVGIDPEAVQLRLSNGTPLTLWFRRGDLVTP
jgi:hypothetical protein